MVRILSQYVSQKALLLIGLEGALITGALMSGIKIRFWNDPGAFAFYTMMPDFAVQALTVMLCFQLCFYYNELYAPRALWRPGEQLMRVGQSLGVGSMILSLLYFLFPPLIIGRGVFVISLLIVVGSVTLSRLVLDMAWRSQPPSENILIVGMGRLATDVAREITLRHDLNLRLAGFIEPQEESAQHASPETDHPGPRLFGHPILGDAGEIETIAQQNGVTRIIVATGDRSPEASIGGLVRLRTRGTVVEDVCATVAALTGRIPLEAVSSNWFIFSEGFRRTRLTTVLKRVVDLFFGCLGFALSAPLMPFIALAIKLDSRGPVLYRQRRVGLGGECFEVLKFRSMRQDAEAGSGAQWAQEDDPRVTRVGRFIRTYRFDELPQFINVIRGEMSFAGPRPERPEFVEKLREVIPFYDERHSVRPGITGWAQVRYPYGASVEDALHKLEYDLFYLKNMSVIFDCAIVIETVKIVLFGRGGR